MTLEFSVSRTCQFLDPHFILAFLPLFSLLFIFNTIWPINDEASVDGRTGMLHSRWPIFCCLARCIQGTQLHNIFLCQLCVTLQFLVAPLEIQPTYTGVPIERVDTLIYFDAFFHLIWVYEKSIVLVCKKFERHFT